MDSILLIASSWLHMLATVGLIGLYVVTYFAVTPAASAPGRAAVILDTYRRAKPIVLGGWVVFAVTGFLMTLVNPAYQGIGRFDNTWSALMLAKHVVVLGMILMSGFVNACPAIGLMRPLETALTRNDETQIQAVLKQLRTRERITVLLGAVILLLTALAENAA